MNATDPTIPATYLQTIHATDPSLPLDHVSLIQEGMVNDVVIVDERLVFRFPKSERAAAELAREGRVLDAVRDRIGIPVPSFTALPGGGVRYAFIPGEPLTQNLFRALAPADRRRLLDQLGTTLTTLHGFTAAELANAGIDWPSLSVRTRADWLTFYDQLETTLFPYLYRYQRQWVRDHFAPVRDGSLNLDVAPALIHGDLAPYHLLVDRASGTLAGLIDFGVAGLGDPAVDVACLLYSLGAEVIAELTASFPSLAATLDRAQFWAGTLELQWALAGIKHTDLSLLTVHIGAAKQ